MNHSPVPYRVYHSERDKRDYGVFSTVGFEDYVCAVTCSGEESKNKANAEFIVLTANNHDALVESLLLAYEKLRYYLPVEEFWVVDRIHDTLKNAGYEDECTRIS